MGEAAEANAAGADTSGYDYKRLHSYPLIRVRMSKCLTENYESVYHSVLILFDNNSLSIICHSIQI